MSNIKWQSAKHLEAGEAEPTTAADLLTLYSMRFCPYAQRTRLVLQHKQIPHQIVNVNLVRKPDWFLAKSATGKVPLLVEPDGWAMIESLITAHYLEELHPDEAPLYPSGDPRRRAKIRHSISKMDDNLVPAYYKLMFTDVTRQEADCENLLKGLDVMQADLGESAYFGGCDRVQMADLMLWPWFERLPVLCQLSGCELPKERFGPLLAWIDRMGNEKAVRETRITDADHAEFIATYRVKNPKYDGY